jgi:hypothetical protein
MSFDSEQDLVDAFESAFGQSQSDKWIWMREFSTCAGVADLVGVRLANEPGSQAALAQVPAKWAYALRSLPFKSEFTLDYVAELGNVSHSAARSILRIFGAYGLCEQIASTNAWLKITEVEPIADRIVAVEAKLRNWRRALYQAAQHLDYASHSWVVLDQDALNNARLHKDEFESRSVGLAGLSTDGDIEVVVEAPTHTPRIPYRFWRANSEIAKRLA